MNNIILSNDTIRSINNTELSEILLQTSLEIEISLDTFIRDIYPKYIILSSYFGFQYVDFIYFYKNFSSNIIQEEFDNLSNFVPINMRMLTVCMIDELKNILKYPSSTIDIEKYIANKRKNNGNKMLIG